MLDLKFRIFISYQKYQKKWYIYYIYIGSCRAISNDIATSTSVIVRPRQKNSLGQGRALGNFCASDEK